MTPVKTLGNLRGSFIASVIGITWSARMSAKWKTRYYGSHRTRPMPSNEKTAVLKAPVSLQYSNDRS